MAPNESMPRILGDHGLCATNDGNHVMVSNPSEMIFIGTPMTKASGCVPEP
jgi:hypothetical protein